MYFAGFLCGNRHFQTAWILAFLSWSGCNWHPIAWLSWVCLSSAGKPVHASVVAKLQWGYRPCLQQQVSFSFHGAPWTSWCRRQQCFTGFIISVLIASNSSGLKYFYWEVSFKCKMIWTFSPQRHVFLPSVLYGKL